MSVISPHNATAAASDAPEDAERGVFALLAVIQNPAAFADRLGQLTAAREDAARRVAEADAREQDLAARERELHTLESQAEEALAVYRRELEEVARKWTEVERLQSDLFEARAKMESDAAEARRAVDAKAAELKTITDGLEERERLAGQVFEQGTALQREYKEKLARLKHIARPIYPPPRARVPPPHDAAARRPVRLPGLQSRLFRRRQHFRR